jgi:uncharacterized membrane protein
MNIQILIGLILTVLPITELRAGLPVIVEYTTRQGISIWPYFLLVILLNISVTFFLFFFFDFIHIKLLKIHFYQRIIDYLVKKTKKEVSGINNEHGLWKYVLLGLFVAVPLPGTGAWTGTFIAWVMKLNRLKSIVAISSGVVIAGLLILAASFGIFSLL